MDGVFCGERAADEEGEGKHLDLHFTPICRQPRGIQPVCGWEDLWTCPFWWMHPCYLRRLIINAPHLMLLQSEARQSTHKVMKPVGRPQKKKKNIHSRTQTDVVLRLAWNVSSNIGPVPSSEHLSPLWITLFTLLIFKRPWSAVPR